MKKIGIDARLFGQTGVGVYLQNFLYFLNKNIPFDTTFYLYFLNGESTRSDVKNNRLIIRQVPYRWHSFSEQIGFYREIMRDKLDLMHFTYFSYPVLYKRPFIATVHDTTPLRFKTGKASTKNSMLYEVKYQAFRYVLKSQVINSRALITPTHTVKKELIELFGTQYENKIYPIYEGVNYKLFNVSESKQNIAKPFFIYVGNFYPHKNVENLIYAFSQVKEDYKLILVGPRDYFANRLTQLINQLSQQKRTIFYHNANSADLVYFYKNAQALIHPSLSEGFGLPLVEAAHFDLPIIASDIPVFKELLDGKYISFDPQNVHDISEKINTFLLRKPVTNYGDLLKKYSFEEMTKETIDIYKKYVG